MIVGTAGHIDHGKTTLVKALTGVDTDRLPEEKKRGISLELGFAFLKVDDDLRIGFIDVPGHERLVHTMVAGATGIDYALLLVAADDGVMPQTREHLAVLSLLGLSRGAVVLTKIDRVDAERLQAVRADVDNLLLGSTLADAPVLAVSAQTGDGLDVLRALLVEQARQDDRAAARQAQGFRLAVDRVFSLEGAGTVVTGTVHAGTVRAGDELVITPGDRPVRVRSVHAQNRAVEQALPGQRTALVLAGVARDEIDRGQWAVTPSVAHATARLDARLRLWHAEDKPLRSGVKVHVHLGAATVMGTVAILAGDLLQPGQETVVQLVLQGPIGAWHGDRVVLRDAAGARTLAGGEVLDPCAPVRYRRTPERLAELAALSLPDAPGRLATLVQAAALGVDVRRFCMAQGLLSVAVPVEVLRHRDGHADWLLGRKQTEQAQARLLAALQAFHERYPDQLGPDSARLRRLAMPRLGEALWRALLDQLIAQGRIALRGAFVHLPEHGVQLSQEECRIAEKTAPWLAQAAYEGAWVRDLARHCEEPETVMRAVLARLARRGELHQVVKDLYYPVDTIQRLAVIAREQALAAGGELSAATYRDALGLGRKRAIQILEYFDRIGLMRRVGDLHRLRTDSTLFAPAGAVSSSPQAVSGA